MTDRPLRLFLPYLAFSLVQLIVLYSGPDWAVTTSKAMLMPLLAAVVVARGGSSAPVAGLAARGGTRLLVGRRRAALVPGLVRAGTAGLPRWRISCSSCCSFGSPRGRAAVDSPRGRSSSSPWYVAFLALLGPHLGGLLVPVAVYGAVLGTMAALAGGRGGVIAVGGALFVVSDSVLALGRFLPGYEFALHDLVVMSTYLAAQGLIAWGVVAGLRADRGAAAQSSPALDRRADATGR